MQEECCDLCRECCDLCRESDVTYAVRVLWRVQKESAVTYPADFHQFFGREEGEDPQGNALWQLCDEVYVLFQLKRNEINSDTWRKMNTVFRI